MKNAQKALRKIESKHRLRRAFVDCHGWVRDALAVVGDWVWCEPCSDFRRVERVEE